MLDSSETIRLPVDAFSGIHIYCLLCRGVAV